MVTVVTWERADLGVLKWVGHVEGMEEEGRIKKLYRRWKDEGKEGII